MSVPTSLLVFLYGNRIGAVRRLANARLAFDYDERWRLSGPRIPLSLSLPLTQASHGDKPVSAFLWGLLPDSEQVLQSWAARYHVGTGSPFGLLVHVGQECAGAVQFVSPDRADELLLPGELMPLTDQDIAERIRELRRDPSIARRTSDYGQFSLAGAQAKTAFRKTAGGWALPSGQEPTTHIFKPARPDLAGQVENEHFCLRLAARLGLPSARSEVGRFGDESAIIVERYDRAVRDGHVVRVHQEDLCQALGVHPARKYENEGGPGVRAVMELLNRSSRPDVDRDRFMQAVIYNFLIGGTDAHAKNYSLLLGANNQVRLAPLYDIASVFPYSDRFRDIRLPMKLGGKYRHDHVFPRHIEREARACGFSAGRAVEIVRDMALRLPDLALETARACVEEGGGHEVLDRVVDGIANNCRAVSRRFGLQSA